MKFRHAFFALALLTLTCFAARPAAADSVLYDNTTSTSNTTQSSADLLHDQGFSTQWSYSDSFTLNSNSTVGGFTVSFWMPVGDTIALTWEIGTSPFNSYNGTGGYLATGQSYEVSTTYVTKTGATSAGYGDYTLIYSVPTLSLNAGQYWLTLSNTYDSLTAPMGWSDVYWDVSKGPSTLAKNGTTFKGSGSNTFQILGSVSTPMGGGSGLPSSVVPEPPSVTLLGLGLASLFAAGLFRKFGALSGAAAPASGSLTL